MRVRLCIAVVLSLLVSGCDLEFWPSEDGPLPAHWTDCNSLWPVFNPLDVQDSAVRIADPYSHTLHDYPGIGCAFRNYDPIYADDVLVSTTWSGVFPHEGTPLIHVNPSADTLGVGAWPAHDLFPNGGGLTPVLLLGTIGNPPDTFSVMAAVPFNHVDGTPRKIALYSSGGMVSVYMQAVGSDQMVQAIPPTALPAAHVGIPVHGIAIDTHFSTPGFTTELDPVPAPDLPVILDHIGVAHLGEGDGETRGSQPTPQRQRGKSFQRKDAETRRFARLALALGRAPGHPLGVSVAWCLGVENRLERVRDVPARY